MRTKTFLLLALCLILALGLFAAACGSSGSSSPTTSPGGVTTSAGGASTTAGGTGPTAGGAQISLENIKVNPTSITVKVGEAVTFVNNDSVDHQMVGDNGEFDSGKMAPGATYTYTPAKAGTIAYHCSIHPSMTGTITVQ
jgi:plastocyanin